MDFNQVTYRRNDLVYDDRHNHRDIEELVRKGRLVQVMVDGSAPGGPPSPKPSSILPTIVKEALKENIRPVVIGLKSAEEEAKPVRRTGRPAGPSKGGYKGSQAK